jgi:hypothetical protein
MWLFGIMHICGCRVDQSADLFIELRAFARIKVHEHKQQRSDISKVKTFPTTTTCLGIGIGKLKSASYHFI